MAQSPSENDSEGKVDPGDLRIVTHDGEPAVEFPSGQILRLRTHVKVDKEDSMFGRTVPTQTEVDADDFAWWTVYPDDGGYPEVSIEPEILAPDSE